MRSNVLMLFVLACAVRLAASDRPQAETNSTVRLTGIVSIGTFKRAYLVREERGHAPEYLSLREGEIVGDLEVRRVDAEHGQVSVLRRGNELLLSFASQESTERHARHAERQFVEEHTRAHEELQRRERERLARESASGTQ